MTNEEIILEVLKEEYGMDVVDESVIRISKKIAEKARAEGTLEVRAAFYKLDWIKILNSAIESRRSSWGENPVNEWRNAGDEVMCAVLRSLEDIGMFEPLFKDMTEYKTVNGIYTNEIYALMESYEEDKEELIRSMRVENGIPICFYCGKKMKYYTPTKGKFKGQEQKYSFVCDCEKYPKNLILNVG